jgi:hypothetical protein
VQRRVRCTDGSARSAIRASSYAFLHSAKLPSVCGLKSKDKARRIGLCYSARHSGPEKLTRAQAGWIHFTPQRAVRESCVCCACIVRVSPHVLKSEPNPVCCAAHRPRYINNWPQQSDFAVWPLCRAVRRIRADVHARPFLPRSARTSTQRQAST